MNIKKWLALLCAALILTMSVCAPALAEGDPPAAEEPAPKPVEPPKQEEKPAEAPKPAEPPKQEEKPAEAPKPAETAAETEAPKQEEKPAENPTDAPAENTPEPAAENPTDAPAENTPEPSAEPGPDETTAPEQTPADGQEPAETPQATEEPAATEAALALYDLGADCGSAAPGQAVRVTYRAVGAQGVRWSAQRSDGNSAGSGEAGLDGFTWTPDNSGVYTITVTAYNGDQTAIGNLAINVRSDGLQAFASPGVRYAMIGERALRFKLAVSGGTEPYTYSIVIEAKGKPVFTTDVFSDLITFKPKVFADHTLKLTVTDASGATAFAQSTIRVSTNETNDALPLPRLGRTMNFAERLVAVAKSQEGYSECADNFIIEEDGKMQCWSYFGYEDGMPYEEWCAMFASWCLKQAGVPEWMMPRCSNCWRWRQALGSRYDDDEDKYIPEPGDLIFFHHDREDANPEDKNFPNHIGIVVDYSERWQTVYTIEGNVGGKVVHKNYPLYDESIVGYSSMRYVMERWDPNYQADTSLDKIEGIGFSVAAPKLAQGRDD